MKEARFYQVAGELPHAVDEVLPALLERIVAAGQKVLLVAAGPEAAQRVDERLWNGAESFFVHARLGEGVAERQPVLVGAVDDDGLAAESGRLLAVLPGAEEVLAGWPGESVLYIFHGGMVERARAQWKSLKVTGCAVRYYKQVGRKWETVG
jgi:DNA polymerase IIIc chi subunit